MSAGSADVYAYVKSVGKFLPTRRTSGISTSELLSRIVEGYRGGDYDNKLERIGRSDIMSRPASEAGSKAGTNRDEEDMLNSIDSLPAKVGSGAFNTPERPKRESAQHSPLATTVEQAG